MIDNAYLTEPEKVVLKPVRGFNKKGDPIWLWENLCPVRVVIYRDDRFDAIFIPPNCKTNFASIPPPFKYFLKKSNPSQAIPAFIHDQLVGEFGSKIGDLSWSEAADVFNILLIQMNAKNRRTLVSGVRAYGKMTGR